MATYQVIRVAADGHAGEQVPGGESDGQVLCTFAMLSLASSWADRGHGSWDGPEEIDGHKCLVVYHESARENCGGYAIVEVSQ
jgi:hypothetical protein